MTPSQPTATVDVDRSSRSPGPLVLFGSGESAPGARRVHAAAMAAVNAPIRACVLETPAGFEPNSARVAGKLADFLRLRLASSQLEVAVVAARRRGTPFSPDDPDVVAPLLRSNYVVLGPGSPSYAAAQLAGSLAWQTILARHRLGAPLVLASAAAIAASAHALPVYEIYKVGEELSWKPGLNVLGPFGRTVAIIPHWNNHEGGDELDTSRSFMGRERFARLAALLPPDVDIVGIDEHTALMIHFSTGSAIAYGRGAVNWLHAGSSIHLQGGQSMPLTDLGLRTSPEVADDIPHDVWQAACRADTVDDSQPEPSDAVQALLTARSEARASGDWALSDRLRSEIETAGWKVRDTSTGPELVSS